MKTKPLNYAGHSVSIESRCADWTGIKSVNISGDEIGEDLFIRIVKEYMTGIPLSMDDNRRELRDWFAGLSEEREIINGVAVWKFKE